jgi:hypothetical protein
MNKIHMLSKSITLLAFACVAAAQQPQPQEPQRIEAKKNVTISWTLEGQSWDFRDILTAYEPVKGHLEPPRGSQGPLAVWKLRLVKDFEDGAAKLHEEIRGTPFRIVLLDADRTIIDQDHPATITVVPNKMDDTIELYVVMPDPAKLKEVKTVRVQKRTDVGF